MNQKINIFDVINNFLLSGLSFLGVILIFVVSNKLIPDSSITGISSVYYYISLLLLVILINFLGIKLISYFGESDDSCIVKENDITPLESDLLPVYLGLFIIALELSGDIMLESIFILLFIFIFWLYIGRNAYFNPFLLILGYKFYKVKTEGNKSIILIIKTKDVKSVGEIQNLIRVNNFTFLKK